MTRISTLLTIAALAMAAPAAGQTQSAGAPATVQILQRPLTLVTRQGLDFGAWFASDGVIPTPAERYAAWDGSTSPGTEISIEFSELPGFLSREGGGDVVPISYGTTSARAVNASISIPFDPRVGLSPFKASETDGSFFVVLGSSNSGTDLVSVDLSGRQPGLYRATITLTVTVL